MPDLDNVALAFHDSEIARVVSEGADLRLTFSAASVHRSGGRPGLDAAAGYLAPLDMVFRTARWTGDLAACTGKVSDGRLVGWDGPRDPLPLPFATTQPIHAQLQFANGATLDVHAAGMECRITGQERFVESYAC